MSTLKCARCGRTDFLTSTPSLTRGMEYVLCADCYEDYEQAYEKFFKRFLKAKPISHKIRDLMSKDLP